VVIENIKGLFGQHCAGKYVVHCKLNADKFSDLYSCLGQVDFHCNFLASEHIRITRLRERSLQFFQLTSQHACGSTVNFIRHIRLCLQNITSVSENFEWMYDVAQQATDGIQTKSELSMVYIISNL